MSFQNAQTAYKQTMKQAEDYQKTTGKTANQTFTPASAPSSGSGAALGSVNPPQQKQAANPYQQNALDTASSGDLTLLLYNGCIKFIDKADKAMEENNIEDKNKFIKRAQDIIRELMITLKTDSDIGQNMYSLYDFIHRRLIDANVQNDREALQEARGFVVDFRDTWKEIIKLDRQQRFGEGGQA
ncbi:flagellar export chaperone FliS [Salibacterium aidingense]|uniref:flagellar export chaperone FliS n=1 Tax=Salibacterium aidingense TaxID=384933 RepID=UPI00041A8FDE|nr:flagellar export chaperone FliS [Salibacterium aidingense]